MSKSGIQGTALEVNVVGCYKLDDKEWFSKQDPYVFVEYGSTKYRTKTCTDGGRNPTFHQKFIFTLIEGLQELNVSVWNSNTFKSDDHIGSGRILIQKALSQGYDDSSWPIQSKNGRNSGEIRLILHHQRHNANSGSSAPQYAAPQPTAYYPTAPRAPAPAPAPYYVPPPNTGYPPSPAHYAAPPPAVYPPRYTGYPPSPAHYASPPPAVYPPHQYPPAPYPPQPYPYHNHPQPSTYYPTGEYRPSPAMGIYPPQPPPY